MIKVLIIQFLFLFTHINDCETMNNFPKKKNTLSLPRKKEVDRDPALIHSKIVNSSTGSRHVAPPFDDGPTLEGNNYSLIKRRLFLGCASVSAASRILSSILREKWASSWEKPESSQNKRNNCPQVIHELPWGSLEFIWVA